MMKGINVFTNNEQRILDENNATIIQRFLMCCVASSGDPVTYDELAAYTGLERENMRKNIKALETYGLVRLIKSHRKHTKVEATFP